MREIQAEEITRSLKDLFLEASFELGAEVRAAFEAGLKKEESPVGREVLTRLLENADLARDHRLPLCQDTGLAVVFVELGQEVRVVGGEFKAALEAGVRQAYEEGYLRKSVCDPLTRKNTGDNTPAVIHFEVVPGEHLRLVAVPKGGGSENMSRLFMLKPADGWEGIKEKVVWTVREGGGNPCPPVILGVAVGGSFERAALEAKKSLLRPLGQAHPDPEVARLEAELLAAVNDTGVGPLGLGGRVTALAVHLTFMPCHIASLPLAINVQCHSSRHAEAVL